MAIDNELLAELLGLLELQMQTVEAGPRADDTECMKRSDRIDELIKEMSADQPSVH